MTTRQRKIVRADGTEQLLDGPVPWEDLHRLLGCATFDVVNLRDGWAMVVDDNGYESKVVDYSDHIEIVPVRPLKPVNAKATAEYHKICRPGTTHQIVGDVAIVPDADYE